MDANFWHQKWEKNEIAFHEGKANPHLVQYFNGLSLAKNSRVFLPLCGKTLDMAWLLSHGYQVSGAELSKIAIEQLFAELGVEPQVSKLGNMDRYSSKNIDIFVGDIFDLSRERLGPIDAVYDRAALVALPEKLRTRYTSHLMEITGKAPQLLICYEYDQKLADGPPFFDNKRGSRSTLWNQLSTDPPGERECTRWIEGKSSRERECLVVKAIKRREAVA